MDNTTILLIMQGVTLLLLLVLVFRQSNENLCVQRKYGIVTDVPASNYVDANIALIKDSSLGQAPLGDPRFWLPNRNPITQGQWGLYQEQPLLLSETQPFDRSSLYKAAAQLPVYTDGIGQSRTS